MKKFIVGLSKVFPWVYMVIGILSILTNPPRTETHDENAVLALVMLVGVILSAFFFYGLSYVIEAACKYLESNNK